MHIYNIHIIIYIHNEIGESPNASFQQELCCDKPKANHGLALDT